jgi:hypothetical protein
MWSCFRHQHMRLVSVSFAAEKFDSRYSGGMTKPMRAEGFISAPNFSAQPLESAAQWALYMLLSPCSTQIGPSREDPSFSAPDEFCAPKLQDTVLKPF